MEELLPTIIEALTKYKEDISDLQEVMELLSSETKSNQDEIQKTKELLNQKIEDIIIQTSKMIENVSKSVSAESVDYTRIEASIKAKINRYITQKDSDISELRADLKEYVKSIKPKDGKDGLNADNDLIISELKAFLNTNKEDFRGLRGIKGEDGKSIKGDDGIGIDELYEKNGYIFIVLTNGQVKKFKLPQSKTIYGGGGGGIDINNIAETTLEDGDYMLINRGGTMFKIKIFKSSGGVVDGAIITEDGSYIVTENGDYLTY